MPKKKKLARVAWSKDDLKTLKTLAKQKKGRDKASALGVSLSTR
jgi:hypothetical protein